MTRTHSRTVKHLSVDRIHGTELHVVSDVEQSIHSVLQVEEHIIQRYASGSQWPHRRVMLFILQDLQPLVRQLKLAGQLDLASRPAACIYDATRLDECYLFINEQVMRRQGYWDDTASVTGLLAHEHAHPLAENPVVRASRRLRVELSWVAPDRVKPVLTQLAETVCWGAPREIFTNQLAIERGFGDALLRLNRNVVESAIEGVQGRQVLLDSIESEFRRAMLSRAEADVVTRVGDLQAFLPLAIEIAPFHRAGCAELAGPLETELERSAFASLELVVHQVFEATRDHYQALQPDWGSGDLIRWSGEGLRLLASALADTGVTLTYQFRLGEGRSGWLI